MKWYISYSGRRVIDNPEENILTKKTDGQFFRYDKEAEENVLVKMKPFVVLDKDLFTLEGYLKQFKKFCQSNEVRTVEDELVVRVFNDDKTILCRGKYTDIKEEAYEAGCKYTRRVYIKFKGESEICQLSFSGGALSKWMEDVESQDHKLQTHYVKFTGSEKGKIGDTTLFYSPRFEVGDEINEEDIGLAEECDRKLQEFLDDYLEKDHTQTPEYDREETNTDSWAFVEHDDRELKDFSLKELNSLREDLESKNQEDSTLYQFVCRGIHEKQKQSEDAEKTEQKPKKKKTDLFKKKKKAEKPDDSWKDLVFPDEDETKLGDLDLDDLKEALSEMDEDKEVQKTYPELYKGLQQAIKWHAEQDDDEDNIPF